MPRRKIQFTQGEYYHIGNRGAGRQSIFWDEQDYLRVIELMKTVSRRCQLTVIAYCLLPNHYHWLVRQDGPIFANQLPKRVFGSYTRTFNNRHGRAGTLFEDRFHGIHVDSDDYLHHLCRYIHANPVRHGIADSLELWPYSNYLDWVGDRRGTLVERAFIDTHFGAAGGYRASLQAYLSGDAVLPEDLRLYLDEIEGR